MALPKKKLLNSPPLKSNAQYALRVSQSKVKLWRQCRYAYSLRYVDYLWPNSKGRSLKFGTIVHKILEADFEGQNWRAVLAQEAKIHEKLFREEEEEYGRIVEAIGDIMDGYFKYWVGRHAVTPIEINGRKSEHKFEIELKEFGNEILWTGKIDAFVKRALNPRLLWLTEHKTFKRKPTIDHRWRNIQSSTYKRAAQIMGWKTPDGTCWDYINSKQPSLPEVTTKGVLSRRSITTLPHVVKRVLKEHNLSELHYAEYLKAVEENLGDYYERVFHPFKEHVIDIVWKDFIETIKEIEKLAGIDRTRNVAMHCDWCQYEPICRAAFQGLDIDHVREHYFHVNKDEYDEPSEESAGQ